MRLGLAFINAGTQRKAIRAGGGEYFSENSSASGRSPTRAEFHTFQRLPKHGLVGPQSRLCPGLRAGMFHVASRWWHCTIGGITARRSCTAQGDAQARSSKLCTSQPSFMGKCHISHSFPSPLFRPLVANLSSISEGENARLLAASIPPRPSTAFACANTAGAIKGPYGADGCQHVQADILGQERGAPGQCGPRRVGGTGGRGSTSPRSPRPLRGVRGPSVSGDPGAAPRRSAGGRTGQEGEGGGGQDKNHRISGGRECRLRDSAEPLFHRGDSGRGLRIGLSPPTPPLEATPALLPIAQPRL